MQFYRFSIHLKGTKCLPWPFACHGLPDNVNSGSFPTPVWGNYSFQGRVRKAEEQRASMSCSKLPVLIIIDYGFVYNWLFFKARENEFKTFYKRKLAFDIFVVNKQILLFLILSLSHFFSLPKVCQSCGLPPNWRHVNVAVC